MFKKMAANPKTPAILQLIATLLYTILAVAHFSMGQRRLGGLFLACVVVGSVNSALQFSRLKKKTHGEGEK